MADMIRLGGLWKNHTREGREYFSGSFGQAKILIFPNERKSKPNDPDYVLYVAESNERKNEGVPRAAASKPAAAAASGADDEVPF